MVVYEKEGQEIQGQGAKNKGKERENGRDLKRKGGGG
jgi:hypothetical protein